MLFTESQNGCGWQGPLQIIWSSRAGPPITSSPVNKKTFLDKTDRFSSVEYSAVRDSDSYLPKSFNHPWCLKTTQYTVFSEKDATLFSDSFA